MKILHLSHNGLPDWRIEKSAITAIKKGHKVLFAGNETKSYQNKIFEKIEHINWKDAANLGIFPYWYFLKKNVGRVLKTFNPDIIHAHNIVSAKLASEFDIPFIYDNHEYASVYAKNQLERRIKNNNKGLQNLEITLNKLKRKIVIFRLISTWTEWEKEIVSAVPSITVSESISSDLRRFMNSNKIFVVPNYPMKDETLNAKEFDIKKKQSCIYAGSESPKFTIAYRNIEGFVKLFQNNDIGDLTLLGLQGKSSDNIFYKNFLPRESMYKEMAKCSIGLVPWKKHWSHKFMNPNKAYEYIHSGLFVMFTSDLISIKSTLKDNCETFENYDELVEKLEYYKNNSDELYKKRVKSYNFGKSNLIWEKHDNNILEAYKRC